MKSIVLLFNFIPSFNHSLPPGHELFHFSPPPDPPPSFNNLFTGSDRLESQISLVARDCFNAFIALALVAVDYDTS